MFIIFGFILSYVVVMFSIHILQMIRISKRISDLVIKKVSIDYDKLSSKELWDKFISSAEELEKYVPNEVLKVDLNDKEKLLFYTLKGYERYLHNIIAELSNYHEIDVKDKIGHITFHFPLEDYYRDLNSFLDEEYRKLKI